MKRPDFRCLDTESIIKIALWKFRAQRREQFIHVGGRGMVVHQMGERSLLLPNGSMVKINTCDADSTTQVEENEHLHAVVRPPQLRDTVSRAFVENSRHRRGVTDGAD